MLVVSLTCPADLSSHGVFFQLGSHPALSLMRARLALIFRAFDSDLPAVATLVFMCPTLLAHTLPFAFFNYFFVPSPELLHLAPRASSALRPLRATSTSVPGPRIFTRRTWRRTTTSRNPPRITDSQ